MIFVWADGQAKEIEFMGSTAGLSVDGKFPISYTVSSDELQLWLSEHRSISDLVMMRRFLDMCNAIVKPEEPDNA